MNPLLHALPLDLTGKAINNLMPGEPHDLSEMVYLPYRCFVLNHGYFYNDSLILEDNAGLKLQEGVHFQCMGNNATLMNRSGLDVSSVIVITSPLVSSIVYATAQMVGGAEGRVDDAIAQEAARVLSSNRLTFWKNVENKPDAYTASGHLHAMWQLYGFEGWIFQADRISAFLKKRSGQRYAVVQSEFDRKLAEVRALQAAADARLAAHIANTDNPHQLTAAQVGLEKVRNFGIATDAETATPANAIMNKYLTPYGGSRVIHVNFISQLNAHIADRRNPHQVTADQVDSYTTGEVNNLLNAKLGATETVVNSERLQGMDYSTVYNNMRANLDAGMIQNAGRFAVERLGLGVANAGTLLTGAQQWRDIAAMFAAYSKPSSQIYYVTNMWNDNDADTGFNNVVNAFANYPVGTLVIYSNQHMIYGYNGNGTGGTPFLSLLMAAKTPSGWVH